MWPNKYTILKPNQILPNNRLSTFNTTDIIAKGIKISIDCLKFSVATIILLDQSVNPESSPPL